MEHAAGGCEQRLVVARRWERTLHPRAAGRKRLLRSPERHRPQSGQNAGRNHRARCQQRRFSVGLRDPALMTHGRRAIVAASLLALSCGPPPDSGAGAPLFRRLPPERTGITFANTITTSDSNNALTNAYIYNGAGVAIGDINNDGLPDIFFAGNQVSSRLYLNKGNMRFEDITKSAGVETDGWVTGVSMVDINHDGFLDIYVCRSGPETSTGAERANLLFINNGDGTFTEAAAQYGIADTGFSQQAVFFDYDRDGDLDLF